MKNSVAKFKGVARQAGFSLIEIVLVLTIIGAATIITISAFNASDDTSKVQSEVSNLNALTGAVRNMFNTQGNYDDLSPAILLKSVSFPEQLRIPNNTTQIKNSWAADGYDLKADTDSTRFVITMKDVPEKSCNSIVSSTFKHFLAVSVDGTTVTKVSLAATACAGGGDIEFLAR